MERHAKVYVSPDADVPVPEGSEPGFIVRYSITRIGGIGPWATEPRTLTRPPLETCISFW